MAKFCGNCGTRLDDIAKVCGQCGMPVEDNAPNLSVKIIDPKKKEKRKKIFKRIVILVLMALISTAILSVASKFTGYNGLLRKVMTAYGKCDIDTLVSLSSDVYYYGDANYVETYFENHVGTTLDFFENSIGHDYRLSYEVHEKSKLSKYKANEILEQIGYSYADFDVSIIKKIVVFDITVTAKHGNKSVKRELYVTMTKEDGTWKLLYME